MEPSLESCMGLTEIWGRSQPVAKATAKQMTIWRTKSLLDSLPALFGGLFLYGNDRCSWSSILLLCLNDFMPH